MAGKRATRKELIFIEWLKMGRCKNGNFAKTAGAKMGLARRADFEVALSAEKPKRGNS